MANLGTLRVLLGLDTAAFADKFRSFTKDLEKRAKGISKGLSGLTNFGSLVGGAGIGAALAEGINLAADFERSMLKVAGASGATGDQIKQLSGLALDLSKSSTYSANELAAAMVDLAKAGITPAEMAAGSLSGTLQLAASEGMGLSRAAEIMAEQMGSFALKSSDAAGIADALAGASISSTASVDGLAQGLSQVGAVANLSGLSLQETAGTLALLAQNGIKGSDAGTSLKTMLMRLVPSTDEAAATMKDLGIDFVNANGSFKNIAEVAEILKSRLGGLSEAQRTSALQTIFGSDALRASAILARSGAEGLKVYTAATMDKTAAEKLSTAQTTGLAAEIQKLRNSFSNLFVTGDQQTGFGKMLEGWAQDLRGLVESFGKLPPSIQGFTLAIAGAIAVTPILAVTLSSLVTAAPAIVTGLGAITGFLVGPWGLAITAAVGTAILFKDEIMSAWSGLQSWFSGWVQQNSGVIANLQSAWSGFVTALGPLWEQIKFAFTSIAETIASAFGTDASGFFESFKIVASDSLTVTVLAVTAVIRKLTEFVQWVTTQIPATLAIFQTTFTAIKGAIEVGSAAFDSFLKVIKEAATATTEALGSLWESIKSAWSQLDFAELGRAIVDGLVNGIKAQASLAVEAAKGMAKSVADGAKSLLGIHSPSRVFEEIGTNVGQGFINGIAAKIGEAGQAIKNLVTPKEGTLGNFGLGFQIGIAPKAIPIDEKTGLPEDAERFEGAWKHALDNVSSSIDQFIQDGRFNFKGFIDGLAADLASSALKGAFESLFKGLAGLTSENADDASTWGNILGSVVKGFSSFEGGGYTGSGSRTGGLDGRGGRLAMVHPNETVIDHEKVRRSGTARRSSGRPVVNVSTPITLMPGVSREELANILPLLKRDILQTIPELIAQGGRRASAFR